MTTKHLAAFQDSALGYGALIRTWTSCCLPVQIFYQKKERPIFLTL
jgi:hypothetical protein